MIRLGASLNALVGWLVNPAQPRAEQQRHLAAIRTLVTEYHLRVVEIAGDYHSVYPMVMTRAYYDQVAALQRDLGFAITIHLPFFWLDASSLVEEMRAASLHVLRATVEALVPLNVETYVLHPWGAWTAIVRAGLQGSAREQLEQFVLRQAQKSVTEALAFLPREKVCVENLEGVPFAALVSLADALGVRLCFDVGHVAFLNEDPVAILREHSARLGEIHLHDARREGNDTRDHLPIGAGTHDIAALLRTLADLNFNAPVVLEMNRAADLTTSLERLVAWKEPRS